MVSFIKNILRQRWKRSTASFRKYTESVLNVRDGEVAVVTYTPAADKMKAFSTFIREGIEHGDWIFYLYPDEERKIVRAKLKEYGVDVEKNEKDGTLYLKSLSKFFMPDGNFDKGISIQFLLNRRETAKRKGYNVREIEDVSDFSFLNGQWQQYVVDYWDNHKWGVPSGVGVLYEPFIMELTAINVGNMSEAQTTEILKTFGGGKFPQTRFIDVLEYADAFSRRIDMPHPKLLGRKFLLEFDPASDYETVVKDFAREAMASLEPTIVFTSSTSAIYTSLAEQYPIKFFLMLTAISTPESISENEIVLPAKNTALILDSLNKILKTYTEENVFLVFDNISELIELVGFDKAYKFLLYVVEMLPQTKATAIFLLNKSAHEPQVVSRIRGLFHNLLTYEKDGLKIVKTSSNV
jgi:KaiC/GvpD/RAD55 family RecA-like ATPase